MDERPPGSVKAESAFARGAAPKLVIDISTLVNWSGPPTGMLRVEQETAAAAAVLSPDAVFALYDKDAHCFRALRAPWDRALIGWSGRLQLLAAETESRGRPSRHALIMALERRRILTKSRRLQAAINKLQRWLHALWPYTLKFDDESGRRMDLVRRADAIGPPVAFRRGDAFFSAASGWWEKDVETLVALARTGVRLTLVCYDILPLIRPDWFKPEDCARFRDYWRPLFGCAEAVIVNSARVAADIRAWCAAEGVAAPRLEVIPLGCDPAAAPAPSLPGDLQPGRFAVYVSTLEPRKNHAMLLRVWRRLLAEGVPQGAGFKLVFVGRRGWHVDALLAEIDRPAEFEDTLRTFHDLRDDELSRLYADCAFTVYPSRYEGFGLPVVEAMARGKPALVSDAGSLPEVVGRLCPLLDPDDDAGWLAHMRCWIEDEAARAAAAERVRAGFRPLIWREVSGRMLAVAAQPPPPTPADASC